MSYFFVIQITSALPPNREYIIINNNPINPFISTDKQAMFIKLNKNTFYVNFNKRKREYIVIPIIPIVEVIKN